MTNENDRTERAPLTEDQPTSGLNPTESSKPIQERDEKPKDRQNESQGSDGERKVLNG